jgi:hypothetical protein
MTRGQILGVWCSVLMAGCGSSGGSGSAGTGGGSEGGTGGALVEDAGPRAGAGGSAGAGGTGGAASPDAGGTADVAVGGSGGSMSMTDAAASSDGAAGTTSMKVTAAGGGTLTAGGASLLVPAGVLASDQVLTLAVRAPTAADPGKDSILGNIYEFGPDGTTFAVPVALTLPLSGTVAADKKVVVAWLDTASGQWFPVASTVSADKVVGLVSHFTRFALLQIASTDTCPFGGACGGSLDGTWKYTQSCLKPTESVAYQCGTAGDVTLRQEYTVGGTVTIAQGRFTTDQMISANATLYYTPACMALLRESMPTADCATLQAAWRTTNADPNKPPPAWTCAGSPTQGCSCLLTNGLAVKTAGTVVVSGQKVTFTQDGKPAPMPDDFCVQGSNLSVRSAEGDVYTAIKQ